MTKSPTTENPSAIPKARGALAFVLVLALFAQGCSRSNLPRGFPVSDIPDRETEIEERFDGTLSGLNDEKLQKLQESLRITSRATTLYDIQSYGGVFVADEMKNLLLAAELYPDNAYAWVQLGAYLNLGHRFVPAICATAHGVDLVDAGRVTDDELLSVALLNLANFQISAGDYYNALSSLNRIELDTPRSRDKYQIPRQTLMVRAYIGLGDTTRAREVLEQTQRLRLNPIVITPQLSIDFPQYYSDTGRWSNFAYLEGLIALEEADYPTAISRLNEAKRQNRNNHDAAFQLANAYMASGEDDGRALAELNSIGTRGGAFNTGIFRPELIVYNQGIIRHRNENYTGAVGSFSSAIGIVDQRAETFRTLIEVEPGTNRPGDAVQGLKHVIAKDLDQRFSDALNNRGISNLALANVASSGSEEEMELLVLAQDDFREASRDRRNPNYYIALFNYGETSWRLNQYATALLFMRSSLNEQSSYTYGMQKLRELAREQVQQTEPERAANAYTVLLDVILESRVHSVRAESYFPGLREELAGFLASIDENALSEEKAANIGRVRDRYRRLYSSGADDVIGFYERYAQRLSEAAWPVVGQARYYSFGPSSDRKKAGERTEAALARIDAHVINHSPWAAADRRDAYYLRGLYLLREGNYDDAVELFDQSLLEWPDWVPALDQRDNAVRVGRISAGKAPVEPPSDTSDSLLSTISRCEPLARAVQN